MKLNMSPLVSLFVFALALTNAQHLLVSDEEMHQDWSRTVFVYLRNDREQKPADLEPVISGKLGGLRVGAVEWVVP